MNPISIGDGGKVVLAISDADFLSIANSINEIVHGFGDEEAIKRTALDRKSLLEIASNVIKQGDGYRANYGLQTYDNFPDGVAPVQFDVSELRPIAIAMRECVRLIGDWEHRIRTGVTVEQMLTSADEFEALADELDPLG